MIMLYVILPIALLIAGSAVVAFIWSVRSGQLDDVDTPPRRMLFDDDILEPPPSTPTTTITRAASDAASP